ncbi:MAG: hypothetical protein WBB45_13400 [Cyclobacteriaceae bacterium]
MKYLVYIFLTALPLTSLAQIQYADTLYSPPLAEPAYPEMDGSMVYIDEGHNNFHTKDGRYSPFAKLLERDGYLVEAHKGPFTHESLVQCDILVISNALNEKNVEEWHKPILPAFTDEEIKVLQEWVEIGGSLFLIADHMPMAGAASTLGEAFGYTFYDGFAADTTHRGPDLFTVESGQLMENKLTAYEGGHLDSIVSFTGQVFDIPEAATPVLKAGPTWISHQPDTAWQIDDTTPRILAGNLYQGAYQPYGRGKIVVFGEAAMFSAQIAEVDGRKGMGGMNHPKAKNNYKLLLNIIHYLDPWIE